MFLVEINNVPIFGAYGQEISGNNLEKTKKVELTSGKNKIEVTCINEAGAESFRALAFADYKVKIMYCENKFYANKTALSLMKRIHERYR